MSDTTYALPGTCPKCGGILSRRRTDQSNTRVYCPRCDMYISMSRAYATHRKEYAEWKNIIIHRFLDGTNGGRSCKDLHESLIAAGLPEWFYKEFEKESGTTILPF